MALYVHSSLNKRVKNTYEKVWIIQDQNNLWQYIKIGRKNKFRSGRKINEI
jgi:hypothetical protein